MLSFMVDSLSFELVWDDFEREKADPDSARR
jgi:hypothetical protein